MFNPRSFYFAFKGITDLFSGRHPNAIIHLLAVLLVTMGGFYFNIDNWEWTIVIVCFIIVISLEAINSAIEYLVDLISPEFNELAGKAKDMAAAAVLLAAIGSVIIAFIIFIPKIF